MNWIDLALRFRAVADEPYEPRGIFNSEMALVLGVCAELGVETVIESGRARGQSTYLLAKYLPDARIVSLDCRHDHDAAFAERRLAPFDNVTLVYGDGQSLVPHLVDGGGAVAVLLDGPKGHPALNIMALVWDRISVGFIHDMRRLDKGEPASFRLEAERWEGAFFTDDPDYVEATAFMDGPVLAIGEASNWRPGNIGGQFTGSYGPTLGVFPCSP